jgi:F420-dependent oxidoreductase-like protein
LKVGVNLGYWGLGLTASDQLEVAREAERLGYDSVWTAEAYGSDAATVLAWLAAQTESIRLGTAILQIPGRSAAMTAMTAATLDQLSGGRLLLGLGASGPQVSEGWHGVRFARQLQRTREYVDVVRLALASERIIYGGSTIELPLPDGPGKPLALTIGPVQERIPLLLAALGPRSIALAGEIADGWLPPFFSPEHAEEPMRRLREGATAAGRDSAEVQVCPTVNVFVTEDLDAARDAMRPFLALYLGGMGSRKRNFYARLVASYGFADEVGRVQELYLDGHKREACAAIPARLIDTVAVIGPPALVRERLAQYQAAGVDTLLLSPVLHEPSDRLEQLRLVAEAAERAALA